MKAREVLLHSTMLIWCYSRVLLNYIKENIVKILFNNIIIIILVCTSLTVDAKEELSMWAMMILTLLNTIQQIRKPPAWVWLSIIYVIHIVVVIENKLPNDSSKYTPKSQRWKVYHLMKEQVIGRWNSVQNRTVRMIQGYTAVRKSAKRRKMVKNRLESCKSARLATNKWSSYIKVVAMMTTTRMVVASVGTQECKKGTLYVNQALMAMQATGKDDSEAETFDVDSGPVGIDNRASACMSHIIQDFVGPVTSTNRVVKGFGGTRVSNIKKGTIRWKLEDDRGMVHTFLIPNSYYVPQGGMRLLSPQHWARSQRRKNSEAGETTTADRCVMFWGQQKHKKTIPLSRATNVATIGLAPGYEKYHAFCAECGVEDNELLSYPASHVSDDELSYENIQKTNNTPDTTLRENVPIVVEDDESIRTEATEESGLSDDGGNSIFQRAPHHQELRNAATKDTEATKRATTVFDLEDDGNDPASITELPIQYQNEDDDKDSELAREFLKYHFKYNHSSPAKLREMARQRIIPYRLRNCDFPVCSACQYGKASRRPWRQKTPKNTKPKRKHRPGEVVHVDQMVSRVPGLVAQMAGFLTKKRYTTVTVFVDSASGHGYVHLQQSATVEATLEAKTAYERYAKDRRVKILHYHADNGVFSKRGWVNHCRESDQGLSFAAVSAHHQNGKAEVRIRHLQDMARTMLIHANKRWPEAITTNLWPYAVRMANDAINDTPWMKDPQRRTPTQHFEGHMVVQSPKHWFHFGCPAYVTDEHIQAGKRPPGGKWAIRSRIGVYLGRSPLHSRHVALVLNLKTGRVSPQFHVKMDPMFHTVKNSTSQERTTSEWQKATGFLSKDNKAKTAAKAANAAETRASRTKHSPSPVIPRYSLTPLPRHSIPAQDADIPYPEGGGSYREQANSRSNINGTAQQPTEREEAEEEEQPPQTPQPTGTTRSGRRFKPRQHLIEAMQSEFMDSDTPGEIFSLQALFPEDGEELLAFKASADPDSMYHHEAMREVDSDEFRVAMRKEIDAQLDKGVLELIHRSDKPDEKPVLPSVWQMKRKRDIVTREVKKHKARLNLDGSKMVKKRDYDQTYAPVASWGVIRLLLVIAQIQGWHTKQLDYVMAFPQAPAEREMYMEIPKGLYVEGDHIFKVKRNIYGQKQAGRVWYQYLKKKLQKVGFKCSNVDENIFYKGSMVYLLYTDDSILVGPNMDEIDESVEAISKLLEITDEGEVNDFLGVNIERKPNGEIHFTQPHLIDDILKELEFNNKTKTKSTPMKSSEILKRDREGTPLGDDFKYRRILGKMGYLEKGSRMDIAYSTHQCARFSIDPKQSHGDALKWIGRYLKGTRDKGTILRPSKDKNLEVWVDAGFAGDWDKKEALDPDTARSRFGYIITYAGCPIIWKSQLMTEIALSSTEAEYTGLSYALREAIPVMNLLREMKTNGVPIRDWKPSVKCKVFEDNSGALEMANVHKYRPRTKHLNCRLHHFRSYITAGLIKVLPIDTTLQLADYLTKPVNEETLKALRPSSMGW